MFQWLDDAGNGRYRPDQAPQPLIGAGMGEDTRWRLLCH